MSTVYCLSKRNLISSASYDSIFELEDLILQTCEAQLLAPKYRNMMQRLEEQKLATRSIARRIAEKTVGIYDPITLAQRDALNHATDTKILLIVCQHGADLNLLTAIPGWRKSFDRVVAYVWDCWGLESYPPYTTELDHIFVPMLEVMESLHRAFGVPVSCLPLGSDALNHGSMGSDRPIDIISYGRMPAEVHHEFSRMFNKPNSDKFYVRLNPRPTEIPPNQPYAMREDMRYRRMLFQHLRRSKITLAFDTLSPTERKFPFSFLTLRWFECGAAGCAMVGTPPKTPLAQTILDWEDAAIALPDQLTDSVEFVCELLSDTLRLQRIWRRNYLNHVSRHDWRFRLQQIFDTLELPLPQPLSHDLNLLQERYAEMAVTPLNF
ncbi:MAG: glycosyltransferase [Kaiparowitsia implicata GSE-PSE-MK54-09C]|nr:glycosyltransferase [Kaiparowitsia implicata GSE-PSE-MK54-09C]